MASYTAVQQKRADQNYSHGWLYNVVQYEVQTHPLSLFYYN